MKKELHHVIFLRNLQEEFAEKYIEEIKEGKHGEDVLKAYLEGDDIAVGIITKPFKPFRLNLATQP